MDPVPSVCLDQECTILISAFVVEDSGIAPNWLSLIFFFLKFIYLFFIGALTLLTILRQLQILIHFLQTQCANKSIQLITYNYHISNNTSKHAVHWLIFLRIDGRKCSATTNSSATLERRGVSEMGRRWTISWEFHRIFNAFFMGFPWEKSNELNHEKPVKITWKPCDFPIKIFTTFLWVLVS